MAGKSDQEKQAEQLYGQIGNENSKVRNRFDNYYDAFDYNKMSKSLDDIFNQSEKNLDAETASELSDANQNSISSLASRGITSGSIVDNVLSNNATKLGKNKLNVLGQLFSTKLSANANLMDSFNKSKFAQTSVAQDADFKNVQNILGKLQLQQSALGNLNDDTWLDDVLGVANAAGGIAGSIAGFGGGGASAGGRR